VDTNESRQSVGRRWQKRSVDQYFLTEKCPFSQKRKFKTKNLKIAVGSVVAVAVLFVLFFGSSAEREFKLAETASLKVDELPRQAVAAKNGEGSIAIGGSWAGMGGGIGMSSTSGGGMSSRQYGASQVVRGSGEAGSSGFGLPMGSTIQARLMNTLLSSDSNQPVVAEVLDDVLWRNSVLVPAGAKILGSASFDDAAKRLQVRFHTFVYPEGDQHSVSALALLTNGSSGLPGDYHSGTVQKQAGRFFGDFIGGLADGMKDRQAGQGGIAFEPGSLKNGLLNGITISSMDQAKSFSEEMQKVRPYLEVPGGSAFLVYLEKEYAP
jgi:hypothetical protein